MPGSSCLFCSEVVDNSFVIANPRGKKKRSRLPQTQSQTVQKVVSPNARPRKKKRQHVETPNKRRPARFDFDRVNSTSIFETEEQSDSAAFNPCRCFGDWEHRGYNRQLLQSVPSLPKGVPPIEVDSEDYTELTLKAPELSRISRSLFGEEGPFGLGRANNRRTRNCSSLFGRSEKTPPANDAPVGTDIDSDSCESTETTDLSARASSSVSHSWEDHCHDMCLTRDGFENVLRLTQFSSSSASDKRHPVESKWRHRGPKTLKPAQRRTRFRRMIRDLEALDAAADFVLTHTHLNLKHQTAKKEHYRSVRMWHTWLCRDTQPPNTALSRCSRRWSFASFNRNETHSKQFGASLEMLQRSTKKRAFISISNTTAGLPMTTYSLGLHQHCIPRATRSVLSFLHQLHEPIQRQATEMRESNKALASLPYRAFSRRVRQSMLASIQLRLEELRNSKTSLALKKIILHMESTPTPPNSASSSDSSRTRGGVDTVVFDAILQRRRRTCRVIADTNGRFDLKSPATTGTDRGEATRTSTFQAQLEHQRAFVLKVLLQRRVQMIRHLVFAQQCQTRVSSKGDREQQ
ncbi:MAG: hypothetical protein MHM6MM_001178 [Cercozoa sp. M6MM]